MIFDTNLLIGCVRRQELPPIKAIISIVSVGELEAFALKADWGIQKVDFMHEMIARYPIVDITNALTGYYAEIDAFSQSRLKIAPLKNSARNMGKNDIWIAATALYLDVELHTADNDFDHLPAFGLRLIKQ